MLRKLVNAIVRPGLVSLMLAVPLAGTVAVTSATPAEAGSFKIKKFKKHHSFKHKHHHGHFKHHKFGKHHGYYRGHRPSLAFKLKKFKKFH
ncbi:MAG: hypothetical protein AAF066_08760 [Pseudomonadota bacterium]